MERASDNYNNYFPPRMSDGRGITDYRSNCILNNELSKGKTSWEYRNYLTNSASSVVDIFNQKIDDRLKYTGKVAPEVPVQTIQNCNSGFCTFSVNDKDGIGLGRA